MSPVNGGMTISSFLLSIFLFFIFFLERVKCKKCMVIFLEHLISVRTNIVNQVF